MRDHELTPEQRAEVIRRTNAKLGHKPHASDQRWLTEALNEGVTTDGHDPWNSVNFHSVARRIAAEVITESDAQPPEPGTSAHPGAAVRLGREWEDVTARFEASTAYASEADAVAAVDAEIAARPCPACERWADVLAKAISRRDNERRWVVASSEHDVDRALRVYDDALMDIANWPGAMNSGDVRNRALKALHDIADIAAAMPVKTPALTEDAVLAKAEAALREAHTVIAFLRSVVLSGESLDDHDNRRINNALSAIDAATKGRP